MRPPSRSRRRSGNWSASASTGPRRRPPAARTEWTDGPLRTVERATFADLAQVRHHRSVVVLDVRRSLEWAESHIDGAVHIPLHELLQRADEVPDRGAVGALRRRLPGLHRHVDPAGREVTASSPSTTTSRMRRRPVCPSLTLAPKERR